MKNTKEEKKGYKYLWYGEETDPVIEEPSALLTKQYRKKRSGDWWPREITQTRFFRPPMEKIRFRRSKLGYVYDELNLTNIAYYANNIDWVFWNYDTEKLSNSVNPMEVLSFQYPSHEHFVYESPRRVKRRFHRHRRRRWGRTTSALADEDNSFYLWKWFMSPKRLYRRGWMYERTYDEQDDPHFYPLTHILHLRHAETLMLSPRLVTVAESYAQWLKNMINSSRLGQYIFDIFPNINSKKTFTRGMKQRLPIEWSRTPEMYRSRRLRFRKPAELALSYYSGPHDFENDYKKLGGIFGEVRNTYGFGDKFLTSVSFRYNPVEHLIDLS